MLKAENVLKNFDEFESFETIISERQMQDMKSVYVDIRERVLLSQRQSVPDEEQVEFFDIEFQIELL